MPVWRREGGSEKSSSSVFDFADHPDYSEFTLAANTGQRHAMTGFDPDYTDIVDYIVRCTHKIWEEKAIGLIYTHYSHNATVHHSLGTIYGRETVVKNTLQNQAMWGDLRAYADDVIWGGDDQVGFYTSHRHHNTATQSGYTEFGPPTGRKIQYWGIADCLIKRNLIVEEWLTHDGISVVRQMGYDPVALARRSVLPSTPHTHGEIDRLPTGQQAPVFLDVPAANDDPQAFVAAILAEHVERPIDQHGARPLRSRPHRLPAGFAQDLRARRLRELRHHPDGLLSRPGADHRASVRAGR